MGGVRQLIMGFRTTQLIYVAARLGLADELADKPQTSRELARTIGADPAALYRLMRALASLGIFAETSDSRFEMTPSAEWLRRDRPGSLASTAILYGDELLWGAYGRLFDAIKTGKAVFDQLYGQPFYDYLGEHPASGALFQAAMTGFSEQERQAILAAYDFSSCRLIVDVGGGQGALVGAVLRANPAIRAVVFDQSPATEETQRLFASPDLSGRVTFRQGDFFAEIPQGGDLYVLKSILHNWDDEAAIAILKKCCAAMPQHGRLLIAERVVPPGNEPSEAKLFDINMLVTLGGKERTESEYAALLRAADLALARVIPTAWHISLVEAKPAR